MYSSDNPITHVPESGVFVWRPLGCRPQIPSNQCAPWVTSEPATQHFIITHYTSLIWTSYRNPSLTPLLWLCIMSMHWIDVCFGLCWLIKTFHPVIDVRFIVLQSKPFSGSCFHIYMPMLGTIIPQEQFANIDSAHRGHDTKFFLFAIACSLSRYDSKLCSSHQQQQ